MEDRRVINGMVYKIRTGISWRDPPQRHGPWQTVHTRFRRYALDGGTVERSDPAYIRW
ncbi:transposase [Streptomyces sp. TE5632]